MSSQACKTCRHWDIELAEKTPSGRLCANAYAKCLWIDNCLPDSIRPGFRDGPYPMRMHKEAGVTCPCYERKDNGE
jgi:hypothetical protein